MVSLLRIAYRKIIQEQYNCYLKLVLFNRYNTKTFYFIFFSIVFFFFNSESHRNFISGILEIESLHSLFC